MSKVRGKVAVVTSGSKGIGAGISRALGAAGAAVRRTGEMPPHEPGVSRVQGLLKSSLVASANSMSPIAKLITPPAISGRRPNASETGPKTSLPGRMMAIRGPAYNRAWVSAEYPKATRKSPYSASGCCFPGTELTAQPRRPQGRGVVSRTSFIGRVWHAAILSGHPDRSLTQT
jgi:hypothetical protein